MPSHTVPAIAEPEARDIRLELAVRDADARDEEFIPDLEQKEGCPSVLSQFVAMVFAKGNDLPLRKTQVVGIPER